MKLVKKFFITPLDSKVQNILEIPRTVDMEFIVFVYYLNYSIHEWIKIKDYCIRCHQIIMFIGTLWSSQVFPVENTKPQNQLKLE